MKQGGSIKSDTGTLAGPVSHYRIRTIKASYRYSVSDCCYLDFIMRGRLGSPLLRSGNIAFCLQIQSIFALETAKILRGSLKMN